MTPKTALIDFALAHGWDDEDVGALEKALSERTEDGIEEAWRFFGERRCPPLEYCQLAAML